jgi:hypothetical protein
MPHKGAKKGRKIAAKQEAEAKLAEGNAKIEEEEHTKRVEDERIQRFIRNSKMIAAHLRKSLN